jgi:hypothetical protein
MKNLAIAAMVLLCSCYQENTECTILWIATHKRPIVCRHAYHNGEFSAHGYTLIDAEGNIYDTGLLQLNLPDTLK